MTNEKMHKSNISRLDGYKLEVDGIDSQEWQDILEQVSDANIYQSWQYEGECHPKSKVSRLILRREGQVVAATQVRVVHIPIIRRGIAYIRWGPLWQLRGCEDARDHLRMCLQGIFQEYVTRRKLAVRIQPALVSGDTEGLRQILTEEGFRVVRQPMQ